MSDCQLLMFEAKKGTRTLDVDLRRVGLTKDDTEIWEYTIGGVGPFHLLIRDVLSGGPRWRVFRLTDKQGVKEVKSVTSGHLEEMRGSYLGGWVRLE